MTQIRTFDVIQTGAVDMQKIREAFPHLIWPNEVGIFEPVIRAEVIKLETDTGKRRGVMILRLYILPETNGTQLVLSQHLSERIGPVMGSTAYVWPVSPLLARGERTLAHNALQRVLRQWSQDRKK